MKFINIDDAKEVGLKMNSQFQFGDFVQCNLDSYTGEGEQWVGGYIVGIKYTVSQVRYDIAVQIGSCKVCLIIEDVRCYMRRVEDGNATTFVDISKINFDDERLE